jgi:hypothetical protein
VRRRDGPRLGRIGRHPRWGGGLAVLYLLLAVLVAMGGAGEVAAQDPLESYETRYEEALERYVEALEVRDAALREHDILMDRQEDARRSRDEDRAREAMRRVHDQGVQVMLLDQQLRRVAADLQSAGQEYLAALERREDELLDAIEDAFLPTTRLRLDREISEIRARYREVERQSGAPSLGELRPLPDVVVDRRDGPEELRGKAGMLENRAAEYDSVIAGLEREIATRERRIQQERSREDLMAGISRFDDDALTGGGLLRPGDSDGPGDLDPQVPVNLADLPLTDQVVLLRDYLGVAQEMRDEALALARVFRERAGGGGP